MANRKAAWSVGRDEWWRGDYKACMCNFITNLQSLVVLESFDNTGEFLHTSDMVIFQANQKLSPDEL